MPTTVDLVSGDTSPLSASHTSNWVARNGGLPGRVRAIARGIHKSTGWPMSRCIATAINMIKKTAATGRVFGGRAQAKGSTRAAHAGAVGEWTALKARAHAHSLELPAVDLATINSSTDGHRVVLNAFTRRMLAKKKKAMPDGSFPIVSKADVGKAQRAIGRAPASKRSAVQAHINRRKKALGMSK